MVLGLFKRSKQKSNLKEPGLGISRKYSLELGRSYVVEESPPDVSFDAFTNMVSTPDKDGKKLVGMIVTRQHPDLVRQKYGLENTPIYWLATRTGQDIISPTNLGILTHTMVKFVEEHPNGIILLDGFEYLVSNNDFNKVMRVVDQVCDHVTPGRCMFILPVDPRALDPKEMALLKRNMEKIDNAAAGKGG